MVTTDVETHPVTRALGVLSEDLDVAAGLSVIGMTPGQTGAALVAVTRLVARLTALQVGLAVHADHTAVGADVGAATSAAWWAHQTQLTRPAAGRLTALGHALAPDGTCPLVGEALTAGRLLEDQARVIVHALTELPSDLDPAVRELAEKTLVDLAHDHDAIHLRRLGAAILEMVAPDLAEDHERRRLEESERRAWDTTRLTMSSDGNGRVTGRFTIPQAQADIFRTQLLALASAQWRAEHHAQHPVAEDPKPENDRGPQGDGRGDGRGDDSGDDSGERAGASGEDPAPAPIPTDRPGPERLGTAFCAWIEGYDPDDLPTHGGVNPTVIAEMTLAQVTGLGDGADAPVALDTGTTITAGQARRWACNAGIIPAVLGTASLTLDMGRRTRYFTPAQRLALAIRDRGCTATGCQTPASMCHAHHTDPWNTGGPTNLDNARLLCGRHHRLIHDPAFHHHIRPDGRVEFSRRTHGPPERRSGRRAR